MRPPETKNIKRSEYKYAHLLVFVEDDEAEMPMTSSFHQAARQLILIHVL